MPLHILELDDIRVASPCTASWDDMTGGDRVRFCAACQKNVFNLSAMKRSEAQALVEASEGKVCARFYRRADGTVLTADCPVGLALVAKRARRMAAGAVATSLGAIAAVLAFLASTPMRRLVDVEGMRRAVSIAATHVEVAPPAPVVEGPGAMLPEPVYAVQGGVSLPLVREQPPVHKKAPAAKKKKPAPRPELIMGDIMAVDEK